MVVESDNYDSSDGEIDDKKHEKLVEDILNLNKTQNLKKPSRTEPTLQISEFNLVKSITGDKGTIQLTDLTKVLKGKKKIVDISNKVKSTSKKAKTLPTPLEKPQADRIRRSVNYEKSRLQLDRWEGLVEANRATAHVTFPLDSVEKLKILQKQSIVYPSTWRLKSDLQKDLEKVTPKVEEYRVNTEENESFPLTLEELKAQRKEAAKLRAHQSFKEAKARRQNKIKSKKYHRILKKEKIKKTLKEFEELQKTNPEEALKKLEDIEKARAHERFSLRHKGTGQWAKNKQIRAKYDKESRQALAQQLALSRELTQKVKNVESDSEDDIVEREENLTSKTDDSNPWINGIKPDQEVSDFVSGYRKYWDEKIDKNKSENVENIESEKNLETSVTPAKKIDGEDQKISKKQKVKKSKQKANKILNNNIEKDFPGSKNEANVSKSTSEWEITLINNEEENSGDIEEIFGELEEKLSKKLKEKYSEIKENNLRKNNGKKTAKRKSREKKKVDLSIPIKKKAIIDEEMVEQPKDNQENDNVNQNLNPDMEKLKAILNSADENKTSNIDPNKFIEVKRTNLNTEIPDILVTDENEETNDQKNLILEAFEDDDIAVDFAKEKKEETKKDTPKNIDLNLPGWGSWGGTNIPVKRRKRFIIKMPPKMSRRDDNKGSLIINEKAQTKIKPHLVSDVPFPFTTVKDYEASIRAPIGNTFVPETAFMKLIKPAVITKMGAIIEPITKSVLVGTKKE